VRGALGQPAAYVRLAGPVGSNSLMQLDEYELESYFSKHPKVYQVRMGRCGMVGRGLAGLKRASLVSSARVRIRVCVCVCVCVCGHVCC
jgi:hypothetical protein